MRAIGSSTWGRGRVRREAGSWRRARQPRSPNLGKRDCALHCQASARGCDGLGCRRCEQPGRSRRQRQRYRRCDGQILSNQRQPPPSFDPDSPSNIGLDLRPAGRGMLHAEYSPSGRARRMDIRQRLHRISVALGVVLAIGVAVTAGAQTPPGAGRQNPTRPQRTPKT